MLVVRLLSSYCQVCIGWLYRGSNSASVVILGRFWFSLTRQNCLNTGHNRLGQHPFRLHWVLTNFTLAQVFHPIPSWLSWAITFNVPDITSPTDKHYSLDSEDDFRSGCQNVSHQQWFFSELLPLGRSHKANYDCFILKTISTVKRRERLTLSANSATLMSWHVISTCLMFFT